MESQEFYTITLYYDTRRSVTKVIAANNFEHAIHRGLTEGTALYGNLHSIEVRVARTSVEDVDDSSDAAAYASF